MKTNQVFYGRPVLLQIKMWCYYSLDSSWNPNDEAMLDFILEQRIANPGYVMYVAADITSNVAEISSPSECVLKRLSNLVPSRT